MKKISLLVSGFFLTVSVLACNISATVGTPTLSLATQPPEIISPPMASPTLAPSASPSIEFTPTVSPPVDVKIFAATGNINVRRGPGLAYDREGVMAKGQNAVAAGRNETGSWLFIPIPDEPSVLGWINTETGYSEITGNINTLPIVSYPQPEPAYIQNCTFHEMVIKPGDIVLSAVTDTAASKKQFNPGSYQAFDNTVLDTLVATIKLFEGQTTQITIDGLNNTYPCP